MHFAYLKHIFRSLHSVLKAEIDYPGSRELNMCQLVGARGLSVAGPIVAKLEDFFSSDYL